MEVEQLLMEIVKLKAQKAQAEDDCAYWKMREGNAVNAMHETEEACMFLTKSECHQKYKRCLAMAERCDVTALFYGNAIPKVLNKDITDPRRQKVFRRLRHYKKWHKRWLEIAEKFKPNSTTQQGKGEKMKATTKPVTIEFFKYDGDLKNSKGEYYVPDWAVKAYEDGTIYFKDQGEMYIKTHEGDHHVSVGDYILRGVNGELYPCKRRPMILTKMDENVEQVECVPDDEYGFTHDFSWALRQMKNGYRIHRSGWNGKGMFAVLQKGYPEGIPCNKQTAEAWGLNEGDLFRCEPYMQLKMVNGSHSMWVPSVNDCLSNDWAIVK